MRQADGIRPGWAFLLAACAAVLIVSPAPGQTPARPERGPFADWDKDRDGFLTPDEFPDRFPKAMFGQIDANDDGRVSRKEDDDFRARRRRQLQGFQRRQSDRRPALAPPSGAITDRDLVYARVGDRELLLDLHRPEESVGPLPVILWVHGGGWRNGSKNNPGRALPMLERGYAVVSVGYRLSGEAIFPAAVEDCQAAVRWVRAHADKYGLDPDRIGAWGSSAGGHLVAMLGVCGDVDHFTTDANRDQSNRVQAVCDWFGPTDFLRMNDVAGKIDHDGPDSPESRFIGQPIQEAKEQVAKANPITYISRDGPPFLIMHGDADELVIYNQSELLDAALKKAGVETTLYRVEGGGHGFRGAKRDTPNDLFERVAEFFDKHLKPERAEGR